MPNPAHYFTEEQAAEFQQEVQRNLPPRTKATPTSARDSHTVRMELHRTTEPCERFIKNLADARLDLEAVKKAIKVLEDRADFLKSEACTLSPGAKATEWQELLGYDFMGADRVTVVHHDGRIQILQEQRREGERTVAHLERAVKNESARLKVEVPKLKARLHEAERNEGMTDRESRAADSKVAVVGVRGRGVLDSIPNRAT